MTLFEPISKRSMQVRGALTALILVAAVVLATILSPLTASAQTTVSDPPVGVRTGPSGQAGPRGEQPDLAAAAETLGVTEDALLEALGDPSQGMPDFAAAAEALGVTEAALQAALGEPGQGPPDFAAAAAELGVTEEALIEALGISDDAPPIGGQGNGQRPSGGQPPAGRP